MTGGGGGGGEAFALLLGGWGGGYRGPLPEFFKNECNVVHSEVRLLLSSRPRQGRIQEFLKGGGAHTTSIQWQKKRSLKWGVWGLSPRKKLNFDCQIRVFLAVGNKIVS